MTVILNYKHKTSQVVLVEKFNIYCLAFKDG
jgi:hypothetical protein